MRVPSEGDRLGSGQLADVSMTSDLVAGQMQPLTRACMRGLVGDSTMTSAVRPLCTAASTALCGSTDNMRSFLCNEPVP